MKQHRREPIDPSDAYGSRWYFSPVSVVVVGMAAMQFIADLGPSSTQTLATSAPAQPAHVDTSTPAAVQPARATPLPAVQPPG